MSFGTPAHAYPPTIGRRKSKSSNHAKPQSQTEMSDLLVVLKWLDKTVAYRLYWPRPIFYGGVLSEKERIFRLTKYAACAG